MAAIAASISSAVAISSYDSRTTPVPSTAKIHGSDRQAPRVRHVRGLEVALASRTGWSCPLASSRMYGSTLMNVTSGCAAAIGLRSSSVGPHWALVQNLGVANTRMNGVWAARASATDVCVEGRVGLGVGRDLREVATDIGRVGVFEAGAGSPTFTVDEPGRIVDVTRIVSAGPTRAPAS